VSNPAWKQRFSACSFPTDDKIRGRTDRINLNLEHNWQTENRDLSRGSDGWSRGGSKAIIRYLGWCRKYGFQNGHHWSTRENTSRIFTAFTAFTAFLFLSHRLYYFFIISGFLRPHVKWLIRIAMKSIIICVSNNCRWLRIRPPSWNSKVSSVICAVRHTSSQRERSPRTSSAWMSRAFWKGWTP